MKLPNKIACTCCLKNKAVRKPVLQKRIAKFGSLDVLLKEYVCRDCLAEARDRVAATKLDRKMSLTGGSKSNSPIMKKYLKGELWYQQPGYVFPKARCA
jgi:hypothetical protein